MPIQNTIQEAIDIECRMYHDAGFLQVDNLEFHFTKASLKHLTSPKQYSIRTDWQSEVCRYRTNRYLDGVWKKFPISYNAPETYIPRAEDW